MDQVFFIFLSFLKMGKIIACWLIILNIALDPFPIKKKNYVEGEKIKQCHWADERGWDLVWKQTQGHKQLI